MLFGTIRVFVTIIRQDTPNITVGNNTDETVSMQGSVPYPAHLFKAERPTLVQRGLRTLFRVANTLMGLRLAPPARLRALVRRPS